jgi:hypothetical protein
METERPPEQPAAPQPFPPLDIDPALLPNYANLVRISHSVAELVMDFACLLPGQGPGSPAGNPRINARILMSPIGAKLFYHALGENLARYEANFGEISLPGGGSLATDLFKPPHPPEPPKV